MEYIFHKYIEEGTRQDVTTYKLEYIIFTINMN